MHTFKGMTCLIMPARVVSERQQQPVSVGQPVLLMLESIAATIHNGWAKDYRGSTSSVDIYDTPHKTHAGSIVEKCGCCHRAESSGQK